MNIPSGNTCKMALLTIALLSGGASQSLLANESASLAVGANVPANCSVSVATIDFGYYDPIGDHYRSSLDASGNLSVHCTAGAVAVVTLSESSGTPPDSGGGIAGRSSGTASRQMASAQARASGPDSPDNEASGLYYDLYSDAAHSQIWGASPETGVGHQGTGTQTQLTVYGSIPGGQNVAPGNFSDTIVATVTF